MNSSGRMFNHGMGAGLELAAVIVAEANDIGLALRRLREADERLASAMSGSAQDAQRLNPEGAPARSSEAGDAK